MSHTFISREILALEQRGFAVERSAIRGWDEELVDAGDRAERDKTFYVLKRGSMHLLISAASCLVRAPARAFAALRAAVGMTKRSDRPAIFHLVYFAEACVLSKICRARGVEHIHAHFGTNSAEVAMLTHLLTGIPYSFTVHGPDEFDRPEYIGLRQKVRNAAFVVAISSYTRAQLFRWSDMNDWAKVKVIRCGLDKAFLSPPDRPADRCSQFVCVARLSGQKGQLVLIEAVAIVARTRPQVRVVLAGDGELRSELEQAIARYGIADNVRITGWLDRDQVRAEILNSRALVLSSFAEGLPVVLMEAMALERPVLTTAIAGVPELVRDGVDGWVYPSGSAEALAAAMCACLDAPDAQIAEMGKRARANCLAHHDIEKSAEDLGNAINGLRVAAAAA